MAKNIKLQNFSRIVLIAALFIFTQVLKAQSLNDSKMPVMQNVGIIPVQWGKHELNAVKFEQLDTRLNDMFKKIVGDSYKFRLLDNELVRISWSNPKDRADIVAQFELNGFIYLEVIPKDDEVVLEVKLLDSSLKLLLLESTVVTSGFLEAATDVELTGRIEKLSYSLLNRLAYDAYVTSVQGSYVTLSAGSKQGLQRGDEVEFIRAFLSDVHPANGTWLSYKIATLGKGTVIESKDQACVVKITSMIKDNVVEAADGIKNFNAPHRKTFKNATSSLEIKSDSENVVLYPLYENDEADKPAIAETEKLTDDEGLDVPQDTPVEIKEIAQKQAEESKNLDDLLKDQEEGQEAVDFMTVLRSFASTGSLALGIDSWEAKGGASAEAKLFSGLILNKFTATAGNKYKDNFYYDTKLSLGYGQTENGSFSKLHANASMFYKMLSTSDSSAFYRGGVGVNFSTFAVRDETFGGWDLLFFNMFVGMGSHDTILDNRKVEWTFDLSIIPAVFGRVGGNESMNDVESAFGYDFNFRLYFLEYSEGLDLGLGFDYGNLKLGYKEDDIKQDGVTLSVGVRTAF